MAQAARLGLTVSLTLLVGVLASCSTIYRNHGYVPPADQLALVEVGADTRDSVGDKIGRPSAQGILNDDGWFYVQSRFAHYGPFEPEEVEREVVAINFDGRGVVENIGRYGLRDGHEVEISRRVTETNIRGVGFIRQLLRNVGRVDASELLRR